MKSKEKILILFFSLMAIAAGAGALATIYYLVFDAFGPFGSGGAIVLGVASVFALAASCYLLVLLNEKGK